MWSILHREMRIASRRPWTFRARVITSVIAFVAGIGLTLISAIQSTTSGAYLFSTLVFISFFFCLIQGVRRAAASIADEKRDGTLGLLFLTDLRPIDIVAGKLFSVAIPLIQPLLAFVPVLTISILLGGTTGGEIFRSALVLAAILFYSISAGLLVSSFSRRSEETGHATLLLLFASLGFPRWFAYGPLRPLRYFSPWSAYANVPDPGYRVSGDEFWWSLLVTVLLSAFFLAAAAYFLPRRWQDEPVVISPRRKIASPRARLDAARRAALLDRNPGEWLAARNSAGGFETWFFRIAIIMLTILGGAVAAFAGPLQGTAGSVVLAIAALLVLVRLASQASHPLAEARRSGAIEMLLATPLDPRCLVTGQTAALRTQFFPLIAVIFIGSIFLAFSNGSILSTAIFIGSVIMVGYTVATFGIWMGLREKSPNAAFFKTFIFTLFPLFLICLWFLWPFYYVILLLASITRLRGRALTRLLMQQTAYHERTPTTPIVPAPPVINSPH